MSSEEFKIITSEIERLEKCFDILAIDVDNRLKKLEKGKTVCEAELAKEAGTEE